MKHERLALRIWMNMTGLVVPLIVMAAYLLGWSAIVRAVLTILCFAGVFGTWLATANLARWRAAQCARIRRLRRSVGRSGA
jgi:hypothetical protein